VPQTVDSRPTVLHFGEFELDFCRQELRRQGVSLALQEKPLQLLLALLEDPGHVVTREDLYKRLWPDHTFVGFEDGLNTAIRKLRQCLGDSAEAPRFIETIPKRGYRFIAPVNGCNSDSLGGARQPLNSAGAATSSFTIGKRVTLAFGILIIGIGFLAIYWRFAGVPPPRVLRYTQLTTDGQFKSDLFTDGNRLYFNLATKSGGLTPAQMSAAGGQMSPVQVAFQSAYITDVSPDGSSLLIHSYTSNPEDSEAYVLPLPAGAPRRLSGSAFLDAKWSPDGQWIAYNEGTDLYVARSDGSASRRLATMPGPPLQPRWSPDGKRLRFFVWNEIGGHSLWQVQIDGSQLQQVLPGWNNPPAECCGQWTPDGRYFIFHSSRGNVRADMASINLWAVREKDEYFRKVNHTPAALTLTSTGTTQILSAAPSRDGKRLFVISGNERYELVRYDKSSRDFLPYLPGVNGTKYRFSRDGLWVAYVSIADNTLWRSRVDGTERLQLTFPPMMANRVPSWSPDGSQIAFAASTPGRSSRIFRISRDGGTPEQITEGKHGGGDITPSWSSDGKILAFGELPNSGEVPAGNPPVYVWLLDLQTRKLTALPGSAGLTGTGWSPDGRYIIASMLKGSMFLFDLATHKWTEMIKPPIEWYAWSRDSKYIQFGSIVKGEPVLKRMRVSDRKIIIVASLKNLSRVGFNSYNTWLGIAPDDSPLALRDISSYDIYALDWDLP